MEMLQLRYFYESAITENFSKTAQKYMVPASSVSASIKRLEQELGTALFIRTGNRVVLNEKGKQLLGTVGNLLTQLDITVSDISQGPSGKQTISILARCTRTTITRWIVRFHRMYPSVLFKLEFEDIPENYGKYDIIISEPDEVLEEFDSFSWRRFDIRVEALETDPLCRGPVTLSQLRDRIFITTRDQKGGFAVFAKACKRHGFLPKVGLVCDDIACRDIVLKSGVCLGVTFGVDEDFSMRGNRYLQIQDFKEQAVINVYYRKKDCEGNMKLFLDLLQSSELRP